MKTKIQTRGLTNKHRIALKYEHAVIIRDHKAKIKFETSGAVASLSASMMALGFIPSESLLDRLKYLTFGELTEIYNAVVPELQKMKGADVSYTPMYPNFPQQVLEASEAELFLNAMSHYLTRGEWKPKHDKLPRNVAFENTQFKQIGVINEEQFDAIYSNILCANESLSEGDKTTLHWFLENREVQFEGIIPFKENLCFVAAVLLERGQSIKDYVKTATDILRVATALSGGDISLAENTKFISFSRKIRREFVRMIDSVASDEDIDRHRNKWIRLFHTLHVGEYSKRLYEKARTFRNGENVPTFNGKIEELIRKKDIRGAAAALTERPGDFARRLDHLLRSSMTERATIRNEFIGVVDKIDTRVLLQLQAHIKTRSEEQAPRVVFPKGSVARATILNKQLEPLDQTTVNAIHGAIQNTLKNRFSELETLGKVWIDPALKECPVPTGQRSASEGLRQVARGTRLPMGDVSKNTIRFFIYWIGEDIDLSATMYGEDFSNMGHVSYTNLRWGGRIKNDVAAVHSGDIVTAPYGACEFIDVNIDAMLRNGVRYIGMNVFVFSGPTFKDHEKVYAGWMMRSKPNSNEVFDAKTVEQKVDLASESKHSIPAFFDLKERKVIWADLTTNARSGYGNYDNWGGTSFGNNVEANRASIEETARAVTSMQNKPNLYDLFNLHAAGRGTLVADKNDADTVFSIDEGVTPYDITEIQSQYMK